MNRAILQASFAVLGVFALATSLTLIFAGPNAIPGSAPVNSTIDNELRFYAVFWSFYGAAALWCIKGIERKGQHVRLLALILFVCGLARTISAFVVGLPHPLFVAATVAEYVLPPLFVFLQSRIESAAVAQQGVWHKIAGRRIGIRGLSPSTASG